jgi:hypothetical protein
VRNRREIETNCFSSSCLSSSRNAHNFFGASRGRSFRLGLAWFALRFSVACVYAWLEYQHHQEIEAFAACRSRSQIQRLRFRRHGQSARSAINQFIGRDTKRRARVGTSYIITLIHPSTTAQSTAFIKSRTVDRNIGRPARKSKQRKSRALASVTGIHHSDYQIDTSTIETCRPNSGNASQPVQKQRQKRAGTWSKGRNFDGRGSLTLFLLLRQPPWLS